MPELISSNSAQPAVLNQASFHFDWTQHMAGVEPFNPDAHCSLRNACRVWNVSHKLLNQLMCDGADPYATDQRGDTVFSFLARCQRNETFKFLYEHPNHQLPAAVETGRSSSAADPQLPLLFDITRNVISPDRILAVGGIDRYTLNQFHELVEEQPVPIAHRLSVHALLETLQGVNSASTLLMLAREGALSSEKGTISGDAAWSGNLELLHYLHNKKHDLRELDSEQRDALMIAAGCGTANGHGDDDFLTARTLLKMGLPVTSVDRKGYTAFMHAAASGCLPLMEILYRAGSNFDALDGRGRNIKDIYNPIVARDPVFFKNIEHMRSHFLSLGAI